MKRKSKALRDVEALAQLKIQLRLIYSAAEGDKIPDDPDSYLAGATCLSRAIPAVRDIWSLDDNARTNHCTKPHCLDYWEHPDKAAEWLFDQGVRPIKEL